MPDDETHLQQNQPNQSSPETTTQIGPLSDNAPTQERAVIAQDHVFEHDDLDSRNPKRRRLSPSDDEDAPDIEAAAARALAISLGRSLEPPQALASGQNLQSDGINQDQANQFAVPPSLAQPEIPTRQLRVENLVSLNDTATHVLTFLAKLNHLEIGEMLFGPPSARGQEYRALKQSFEERKRIYLMNGSPFLSPYALDLRESGQIDMIRKVNLAVFMGSIFSGEIGLRIMDMNFIDVFVPEGGRLLKAQGSIYLELKTHAFMAATRTASAILNQVMIDLFPSDMDKHFLAKRNGSRGLAPSEQDFLKRLASRRDILYSVIRTNKLGTLPDTYRWNDFAREVSAYLTKHMESLNSTGKEATDNLAQPSTVAPVLQGQMESQFSLDPGSMQLPLLPGSLAGSTGLNAADDDLSLDSIEAFVAQAARAAALSMGDSMDIGLLPPAPTPQPAAVSADAQSTQISTPPLPQLAQHDLLDQKSHQTQFQHYNPAKLSVGDELAEDHPEIADGEVPHSSQTAPTQVLYERARQVATNKALLSKKLNPPSHRRPWTTEEENALMTGLDQVKGPHWSQILAMYGPGGTIDESLKDRNQVQLKDKARNLKLFFLKAGIEVPYYLQAVTGDLRTRAPGQAEKKERERLLNEGERAQVDESQANVEGTELEYGETENRDSDEPTPNPYQAADEQPEKKDTVFDDQDDPEFDMEAMIAKAAASATQGLRGPPWGIE